MAMFYWYNAVDYKACASRPTGGPAARRVAEGNGDFLVNAPGRRSSASRSTAPVRDRVPGPILGKGTKLNPGKLGLNLDRCRSRPRLFDGVSAS